MPLANFTSFLAIYRNAIATKKVRFCTPNTTFNYFLLRALRTDGYIWSFWLLNNKFEINSITLSNVIKFNWIIRYTSQNWKIYVSFKELLILTKAGGYFILSTKCGILNDSAARKLWIGGLLLLGIF